MPPLTLTTDKLNDLQLDLMKGASSGNASMIRAALGAGAQWDIPNPDPDPTAPKARRWTPLGLAVAHNHLDAARTLLYAGADPNQADPAGDAPLHLLGGALEPAQELLDLLIAHAADPNRRTLNGPERTVGRVKTVADDPPLLTLLTQYRHWPLAERLLKHAVDPTLCSSTGQTALHRMMAARWNGKPLPKAPGFPVERLVALVPTLIERGVDVTACDVEGRTALDLAAFISPVVQALIEAGGTMAPTTRNLLALSAANKLPASEMVRVASWLDLPSARGPKGATVVHQWARENAIESLEHWCATPDRPLYGLLETMDLRGETPLFAAVKTGSLDAARWLLDHGVRADRTNRDGNTTLHVALGTNRQPGLDAMMLLLVEHDAPADRLNKHGVCALSQQNHSPSPWVVAWERRQLLQSANDEGSTNHPRARSRL